MSVFSEQSPVTWASFENAKRIWLSDLESCELTGAGSFVSSHVALSSRRPK